MMQPETAKSFARRLQVLGRLAPETVDPIARQLIHCHSTHVEILLSEVKRMGYDPVRLRRVIDYLSDPYEIQIPDLSEEMRIRYLYRCAELFLKGRWTPFDEALRRPDVEAPLEIRTALS